MTSIPDKPTKCRECNNPIMVQRIRKKTGNVCEDCKRLCANRNQSAYYYRQHEQHKAQWRDWYKNKKLKTPGQPQSPTRSITDVV